MSDDYYKATEYLWANEISMWTFPFRQYIDFSAYHFQPEFFVDIVVGFIHEFASKNPNGKPSVVLFSEQQRYLVENHVPGNTSATTVLGVPIMFKQYHSVVG